MVREFLYTYGDDFFFMTIFAVIVCICSVLPFTLLMGWSWWNLLAGMIAGYLTAILIWVIFEFPSKISSWGVTWKNFWWLPFSTRMFCVLGGRKEKKVWCEENCNYPWDYHNLAFRFSSSSDAVAFKIRYPHDD